MDSILQLARSVRRITLRPKIGIATFTKNDGSEHMLPLGPPASGERINIVRFSYDLRGNLAEIETADGLSMEIEMPRPGQEPPICGRPIVYLDQCHWSALANHQYRPEVVPEKDRAAAEKITDMALSGEIIIPFSAGHFLETSALYGVKRINLASTMIRLSRGWRMRHPVRIRMSEIREVLTAEAGGVRLPDETPAITLDATALFQDRIEPQAGPGGFAALGNMIDQISTTQAHYDILLDPDRVESRRTSEWEDHLRGISRDAEWRDLSKDRRRRASGGLALADVIHEVMRVVSASRIALTPEEVTEVLVNSLADMPFVGLYADVLNARLSKFEAKWEANDLVDMLFLTSAAAYADVVVGERAATNYLNEAWNGRKEACPVVRTLGDAADRL
ncbi:hypothetical protein [Streptomyces rubiginosohelvolus]|uniref:hypothetical protein n=1 Tax=Streptomyces rubiginosohelvolus TaxID=67362 RepID=UPI0036BD66FC